MAKRDSEIAGLQNLVKLCTQLAWREENEEEEEEDKKTKRKRKQQPSLSSIVEDVVTQSQQE